MNAWNKRCAEKKEKEQCRNRTREKKGCADKKFYIKKSGNRTRGVENVRVEDVLIKKKLEGNGVGLFRERKSTKLSSVGIEFA